MTSPLRALGRELGVQPHVGFWDPRSRAADDNAEGFARRRLADLQSASDQLEADC